MIQNGDVFITNLERGFWGAFRIIQSKVYLEFTDYEYCLIAITSFIDTKKPIITDSKLTEVLIQKRFSYKDTPNINIYSGKNIEKNFEYLGNIPSTDKENNIKVKVGNGENGFPMAGAVQKGFGYDVFYEWRWDNENDIYKKEVEEQQRIAEENYHNRVLIPKKMMGENLFWNIISLFNWHGKNDGDIIEPAIKYLSSLKVTDIKQFEENLTFKLYCLDTKEHAKNIGEYSYSENDDYVSVDFFLYARCAAVSKGKELFEEILNNPTKMPKNCDFEALLIISEYAYERKTKKEFNYVTGCDYETYSNKIGWK